MSITVILAAVAVGFSIPLLGWALGGQRAAKVSAGDRLRPAVGATDLREVVLSQSAAERVLQPLLDALAGRGRRLTPAGWIASLERRISLAGNPEGWRLERVLALKAVLGVVGAAVGLLMLSGERSAGRLMFAGLATALGYFAPDLMLYSRGKERQEAIRRELPDTIDQMTISVEAGLGFDAAMSRAGRAGKGPLAEEIIRTLQEVQLGLPRAQALRNLADRTDAPDLRHFVVAAVQAESFGVPIADVLRTQARELRIKRRQRAEERALKIPVKVIFPLILCILPTLFIVLMGPAAIRIARTFM